jgi:YVTN family beta-propeller protein
VGGPLSRLPDKLPHPPSGMFPLLFGGRPKQNGALMKTGTALALLALAAGCATAARARRAPLAEGEGELRVYLDPLPQEASHLAFQVESLAALAADGTAVPLDLLLTDIQPEAAPRQRILAVGHLVPGPYSALALKLRRATLAAPGRAADLPLPAEPSRVAVPLAVGRGRATVVVLSLDYPRPVEQGPAFIPSFAASVPPPALSPVASYCAATPWDEIVVLDKNARRVAGAIPVGREPQGIAFDPRLPRAYVALSGEDRIAVVDVNAGEVTGRIPLRAGDQPREVGLTPDGRTLLVVNAGSNTVSFVDPSSTVERERVQAGEEPGALLLEPGGRRAYVLNRRSSSITVLDVANRGVAATLRTDAEPLRARTNRAGTRLYVIHGGSPSLSVFSLPDLQLVKRVHVGLGASALAVSPRSDLVYVGRRDGERLQVFDPFSFFPVSSVGLAAPPSHLAVDETQDVLFAVEPSRRSVEAVDLVSGRSLGAVEVGDEPYQIALPGGR